MPDRPVIANNTPLVALWSIGQLSLLHELYGDILIPQAVHREFLATETSRRHKTLETSPWIHPTSLTNPQQALVYVGLDRGEAEVLALAIERSARLVILDERRGRQAVPRAGCGLTAEMSKNVTRRVFALKGQGHTAWGFNPRTVGGTARPP